MATLVRHVMSEDLKHASPDMSAADAAGLMRQFDIGSIPLVEEDRLVGLVTDRDLVTRVLAERQDPTQVRLGDIASQQTIEISPDADLTEAQELMRRHRIRRLPVVKGDRIVGIVSMGDLAVQVASKRAVGQTLAAISESPLTAAVDEDGPAVGTPDRARRS